MKAGDLVQWSMAWLSGCDCDSKDNADFYRNQVGILIKQIESPPSCWFIVWNNGTSGKVHREYVEII